MKYLITTTSVCLRMTALLEDFLKQLRTRRSYWSNYIRSFDCSDIKKVNFLRKYFFKKDANINDAGTIHQVIFKHILVESRYLRNELAEFPRHPCIYIVIYELN